MVQVEPIGVHESARGIDFEDLPVHERVLSIRREYRNGCPA